MTFETIRAEILPGGVGLLTLYRPERRNALSIAMRREISACLGAWREAPEVGAAVLTGSGAAFCAGFDLTEFGEPGRFDELLESSARYHRDVWAFPKPLLAAVNGPAVAGGFDLATLCDLRLATEEASFAHPELRLGAPPIFTPLRWIVGDGLARDLVLTGRRLSAEEALRAGLVSRVLASARLLPEAVEVAVRILEAPAEAVAFLKSSVIRSGGRSFEEGFRVEHDQAFREVLLPRFRLSPPGR